MRLVEVRIEQLTVEEARRMDKLLGYGEDDLVRWKRRVEPHHFNTVRPAKQRARGMICLRMCAQCVNLQSLPNVRSLGNGYRAS